MSADDNFSGESAPVRKKGSGGKIFLILGTIFGLCLVVCCGGGVFLYYKFKDAFQITTDAQQVRDRAEEIVHVELPQTFTPMSAVQITPGPFTMKMAIFQTDPSDQGGFVLMEMQMNQPGQDPKLMREQMLLQMRQQQAGGGNGFNQQIIAQTTETKKFKINGETVEFDFVKGTRSGDTKIYHQVTGTFASRSGTVLMMVIIPENQYDEEQVLGIIKSIRIPGSSLPTELVTETKADPAGHDASTPVESTVPAETNPPDGTSGEKPADNEEKPQ